MSKEHKAYQVRGREDWSRVFLRDQGWTGSDNTYSIPLGSKDGIQKTVFTFGDSFIGTVDAKTGNRSKDSIMVNNALGVYRGSSEDPKQEDLEIFFGEGKRGQQAWSLFVPPMDDEEDIVEKSLDDLKKTSDFITSPDDKNYYWLQDGLVEDGKLYIYAMRVAANLERPEGFRFSIVGTDLLSMELNDSGMPDFDSLDVLSFPHDLHEDHFDLYFGAAVLVEEDEDYVYVYGLRQENGANLVLARYKKGHIEDFAAYEFYTEDGWSKHLDDILVLASGISSECSVSRLDFGPNKGKLALIYNRNGLDPYIEMRLADRAEGPFLDPTVIYTCPEEDDEKGIYCYNAKAHPELSRPGTLLISYNVNTRKDEWNMKDGRIYRTRWIELYADEDDLHLHPLLKDAAILQRDVDLKLHGWATPGDTVTLELGANSYQVSVSDEGEFAITIPAQTAGGPHRLRFSTASSSVAIDDVYFGDVYLAGGQSNMQLSFGESMHKDEDRTRFKDPLLRANLVPQRDSLPLDAKLWEWTTGDWNVLEGEHLDGFSAVAAYAGLRLRELDSTVPIGIVGCYMGATSASCWTSKETLAKHKNLSVYQEEFEARISPWRDPEVFKTALEKFQSDSEAWQKAADAYRKIHPEAIETDLTKAIGQAPWPPPENDTSFMRPSGLYETMLKPLRGASFKSALFYQGESDTAHPELYLELFGAMLSDWQELFGKLPIVQVQLPSYSPEPTNDDNWGRLREAQRQASLSIDGVRHIVALDESNLEDLHPTNKRLLGLRIAEVLSGRQALDAYLKRCERNNGGITLHLDVHPDYKIHVDDGFPFSNYEVDGDKIHLHFGKTPIHLAYGAHNSSVATVFCYPKDDGLAPKSKIAQLYGTLEAFILELD